MFLIVRFFIVVRVLVKTHTDLYINSSKCPLNISKLLESGIQACLLYTSDAADE